MANSFTASLALGDSYVSVLLFAGSSWPCLFYNPGVLLYIAISTFCQQVTFFAI